MKKLQILSNNNQHIKDYLDAYLAMPETDFAVLLKGPWGCGKTHFIQSYLHEKRTSEKTCRVFAYVSINGVATSMDFERRILSSLSHAPDSPIAETLLRIWQRNTIPVSFDSISIGCSAASLTLKKCAAKGMEKAHRRFLEQLTRLQIGLLVLDDFERCSISIHQRTGLLSELLNAHVKIVIVCAENELGLLESEAASSSGTSTPRIWQRCKEKIVGKTFLIDENIEQLFGILADNHRFPTTHSALLRNKDRIIACFKNVKDACNYRALVNTFRDVEFWFSKLPKPIRENNAFTDDFVTTFIVFSYEAQIGHISEKEFGLRQYKENEKTPFEKLLERHHIFFDEPFSDRICLPLPLWKGIIFSASVNESYFLNAVAQHPSLRESNAPEWQNLWHWYMLPDTDAISALHITLNKLENHEYRDPEIILHVFSILLGLATLKALPQTREDVKNAFADYLEHVVSNNGLDDSPNAQTVFHTTKFSLGVWNDGKDPDIQLFKKQLSDAVLAMREEKAKQHFSALSFEVFDLDFFRLITPGGEYFAVPLFHMLDSERFWNGFCQMGNDDKGRVLAALESRFENNALQKLTDELPFFRQLSKLARNDLQNAVKRTPRPPSFLRKKAFEKLLEKICHLLELADRPLQTSNL